ncbi:CARDB domain-containing protein [Archangium sp.]|uniref:CARDB domain-containing protein n=1 Tax=Archangium sp. TaxID=1872627 RepID=UPI00389A1FA1
MNRPDSMGGAARFLVMGLLALAGCGREEASSEALHARSVSAALESGTDLVVTEVRGPANVRPGQGFTASVTVCNQGSVPSSYYNRPRLELFLSMDAALTPPDPFNPSPPPADQVSIGWVEVESLAPEQCVTKSVPAYAWLPPAAQGDGAYYLAAAVDTMGVEQESREDNNVLVSGLMGVGYRADLVVTAVSGPASASNGQSFTASVKVCNQGTTPTSGGYYPYGSARVELFLSMDTTLTLPDPANPSPAVPMDQRSIGYVELDTLYEGQCVTKNVPVHAWTPPDAQGDGAFYLAAAVDTTGVEKELREDNNVRVGALMGVGNEPDLVVTEVKAPANVRPGQGFSSTVKVCNQGTSSVYGSYYSGPKVELFVVTDATAPIPANAMPLGSVVLDQTLSPSQCVTKSVPGQANPPLDAPVDGAYPLVATVDRAGMVQELREDNNVLVSGKLGVGYRSDLVVTEVKSPASLWNGQGFTATVKVCNQGTSSSSGYYYSRPRVELFLSTRPGLTLPSPSMPYPGTPSSQVSIGWVELDGLYEGQCVTKSVYANAWLPPETQGDGAYYLAAAVDTMNTEQELREDNNVRVEGLVGVGYRSDLVVSEVKGPASAGNGQSFTASVKVCNQGTSPTGNGYYPYYSRPRVELFLSTDTELTLPDPSQPYGGMPMDQMSIGWVELEQPLAPRQCVTKSVNANAWVPPAAMGMDGAYYLAAAVDTMSAEQELREDNNVRVGGLMGVGYRSDLVVTEVSFPASLTTSQGFTATVKVCNQGSGAANYYNHPRVELFLSMDAELTMPDPSLPYGGMPMDQMSIGWVELDDLLGAGECATKSVPANAGTPPAAGGMDGAYYLAAAVDTTNREQELREDNNIRVGGLMGVGNRSDLVVSELSAPASVGDSQNFTATVKVCNQGTTPTSNYYSGPRVSLYLTSDASFSMPEQSMPYPGSGEPMPIGWVELDQPLYPAQCVTKSVNANAWLPMGPQGNTSAYYLVAAVDTNRVEQELREDNNVRVGGLLGVGYGSDLVVSEVRGPASASNGQSFTASVKVCNQGTTSTGGYYYSMPRVELFLSMDAELTMPDPSMSYSEMPRDQVSIGSVELEQSLAPGQCVTKDVSALAWVPPESMVMEGAYYLAAAVDTYWVEQELREDNNVRVGALMGVGYRSDLVVSEVSGPASAGNGESFTASVKVCNQGTASTGGYYYSMPRVELFLSMDSELTLQDPSTSYPIIPARDQTSIGWVELDQPLSPGQCVTKSVNANAWLPPDALGMEGAYYLAAAVDSTWVEQELREDNNVRVGGLMGVGYRSDLVVTEVSGPASVKNGENFTASVLVCNQGAAPTNSPYYARPNVELFLTMDAALAMPNPATPVPGPSSTISIGYVELEQILSPGQCVRKSVSAQGSLPPMAQLAEAFYLAAAVDTNRVEQELREDNNVRVGGLMSVGSSPDLVVSEVSAPASVMEGQQFTASVKVCNQGTMPTGGSYSYYGRPQVELFLSTAASVVMPSPGMPYPSPGAPMEQVSIGYVELEQPLYPGQCVTKSVSANAWPPPAAQGDGAYYLAAAVDTTWVEQELREDNNLRVGGLLGVGSGSDLVVSEVTAPASAGNGQQLTASVKVCNQGTTPTQGSAYNWPRVELYLSSDTELTLPEPGTYPSPTDQTFIGSVELDQQLYPGRCVTKSVSGPAYLPPGSTNDGAYYLVAAVDTNHVEQELREDNNVHVGGLLGVGNRADLVVSGLSAPANVGNGQQFTASLKVCNQGTAQTSMAPQLQLLLSMDTELTLQSPGQPYPYPGPMDQTMIAQVDLPQPLAPGQCVTKDVDAHAWLPPLAQGEGTFYLAAVVDPNGMEQELREDNNVHVGGLLGVGYRPDLVVKEVSGPASVMEGQQFTASVKVCNQGTSPVYANSSRPNVELFLSLDAEVTPPSPGMPYPGAPMEQVSIGYVELDQLLNPSQCVTKSVTANAWPPPSPMGTEGAYYLAAIVDTNQVEQELREDNNVHVGGLLGVGYRADLVVSEVSAPASVSNGQQLTASVKVCNQGTTPTTSNGARVELYLSRDTELTLPAPGSPPPSPDPVVEQVFVGSVELDQPLSPSQCVTKSVSGGVNLPPGPEGEGAFYLAAAVDTNGMEQELREDNNVHVGGQVGVGYRADLVVSELSAPPSTSGGQPFTASVTVCNQGTTPTTSNGARVELFLSMDTELTLPTPGQPYPPGGLPMDQVSVGSVALDQPLSPSQCVTKSVPAWASLPPQAQGDGAFYLAAAVDTLGVEQELREDNNVRVSGLMGVGNRADLVVSEVTAPASVGMGQPFTVSVKVCNQGTAPTSYSYGGARVELFLSVDTEVLLPTPGMPYLQPMDQMSVGYVDLDQPLSAGQCVTKDVPAYAWMPPMTQGPATLYVAAAVDTTWMEQELREDNNLRVDTLLQLTP